MTRYALLRLLALLWPPRPLEAPMPPRNPIVDRWLALTPGPFQTRLLAGRVSPDGAQSYRHVSLGAVIRYAYLAEVERRDDGEEDLSGIEGLFWNLVAS